MASKRARLDRFISHHACIPHREVQRLLACGHVKVNGQISRDAQQLINPFTHIVLNERVLQANTAHYLMLNKPPAIVSATKDTRHRTVIDLLPPDTYPELHIAGRLDFNSSGLLLLTNDGRWSRFIASPENNIQKRYRVTLEKPIDTDYISAFAAGMYFAYEGITTRPASLKIINDFEAEVSLVEGRYHQIKRMFARFQNKVLTLKRIAIGPLKLDDNLALGQHRLLSEEELKQLEACKAI